MSLLSNFEVSKVTLHYILPSLCDRQPPVKSKQIYDAIIDKIAEIDASGLFQEALSRVKQKNSVVILHSMDIIAHLVLDGRLTAPEVFFDYAEFKRIAEKNF